MNKKWRIIFKQRYMGKILQDSYIKCGTQEEMDQAIDRLYEDSCIFEARYEEVKEDF